MSQRQPSSAYPWLLADIGGTNARFGWVADASSGVQQVHALAVAESKPSKASTLTCRLEKSSA